jgi:pimeloyl-ACP methyl ester carboxylesterase
VPAALFLADQPGAAQHGQMLGDRRPAQREPAGQLAGRLWPVAKGHEQLAPDRIGQRTEDVRHARHNASEISDASSPALLLTGARLTRQTAAAMVTPIDDATWRTIPSTYLVCADDRATPPAVQREQAERAGRVVELATGHHPMLSRPDLVAAEVVAVRG